MKQRILILTILLLALPLMGKAFSYQGLNYDVISETDKTVSVGSNPYVSGHISIPAVVVFNDISYSVISIGEWAFFICSDLTGVEIPNSVISIEERAFSGCPGLTSVEIPNSVTSIGEHAFGSCQALTSIEIGNSVTSIGGGAFYDCVSLTGIEIPNSVTSIGGGAFENCTSLKDITIMDGDETLHLEDYVFSDDRRRPFCPLETLYLGRNISYDSLYPPFYQFNSLQRVIIGNSVTSIESEAFKECKGLTDVKIGNSVTSIRSYAFAGCSGLTSVEIPNSVTSIGRGAFDNCSSLTDIEIPNSVTSIGRAAFSGSSLTGIEIPNSVTSIGEYAFYYCYSLKNVEIPYSVTSIGESAFDECPSLEKVVISDLDAWYNITFNNEMANPLYFANHLYLGDKEVKDLVIPTSLSSINDFAFIGCKGMTSIEIPGSLSSIGESAFAQTGITALTLPESLTSIGKKAFVASPIEKLTVNTNANLQDVFSLGNITEIIFGDNVTTIPSLSGASKLTEVRLPSNLKAIEANTFSYCASLKDINYPESLTTIGDRAFYECRSLNTPILPSSLNSIGEASFYNCSNIKEITLPTSLKSLGSTAFWGCPIKLLTIPKSLKSIGSNVFTSTEKLTILTGANVNGAFDWANLQEVVFGDDAVTIPNFEGAALLTDVTLPTVLEVIPANAFKGCTSLEMLEVPVSLTTIGDNAFYGCTSLEKINLHKNVNAIGEYAFYNCPQLRSINVPNGVESIKPFTFSGCSSLTEVNLPGTVATIGEKAFQGCTALINVSLGTGTYDIKDYVFDGCPNIKNIYSLAKNPPYAEQYTFPIAAYNNAYLYVREEALGKYNQQNPWYRFDNMMTVNDGISLSHYEVTMAGNQVFQLGVYGSDNKVKWTTSNPEIAYANECGLIVAMGPTGTTTITATVDGVSVSCRVIVNTPRLLAKGQAPEDEEEIEPNDIIVESIGGEPLMVNVRLIPVGSRTVLDWSSSDDAIASVQDGLVTVNGDGDVEFSTGTENGLEDSYEVNTDEMETNDPDSVDKLEMDSTSNASNDIFTLTGVCLKRNATQEDIDALAPGNYIIGGKKVVKK